MPVGRMVLNRSPDNFFAETEQVAFCTAHVISGGRPCIRAGAAARGAGPRKPRADKG